MGAKLNGDCAAILRSNGKINPYMAQIAIQQNFLNKFTIFLSRIEYRDN